MSLSKTRGRLCTAIVSLGWLAATAHGQWTPAAMLNEPWERDLGHIKTPQIDAAATGGFHAKYFVFASPQIQTKYRRFFAGTLQPPVLVEASGFRSSGDICEGLNGTIHMVWEDWNQESPQVGWARSTNGGASWAYSKITTLGDAKHPQIAPFGFGGSPDIVMSYWQARLNQMRYERFNGTTWSADTAFGNAYSVYQVVGTCRSLLDGTVWRGYGNDYGGMTYPVARRYNGSGWDPEIPVEPTGFFARQSIAVNMSGQVMYLWERDEVFYSKLYTPGVGWAATQALAYPAGHGLVTAIPGTNNFYAVYITGHVGDSRIRVRGRMWSGGTWQAEEVISGGLADAFSVDAQVAAGPDGTLFACWEYWGGTNGPTAYYSVRPSPNPGPRGTVTGVVRDQYGVGVTGATVATAGGLSAVTGAGGAYSLLVPVGTQTLTATKAYYTSEARSVTVLENQTTTVNFAITARPPDPVSLFVALPAPTSIQLQWHTPNSGNCSGVMIRYKSTGYPTGPTDGNLLVTRPAPPSTPDGFAHTGVPVGARQYYAAFAYFADASTHYAPGVTTTGVCSGPADFDRDGDVDLSDFSKLQLCFNGPNLPPALPGTCGDTDFDADGDTDHTDFALFRSCFNGPNNVPVYDCVR